MSSLLGFKKSMAVNTSNKTTVEEFQTVYSSR